MKTFIYTISLVLMLGCRSELRTKGGNAYHETAGGSSVHIQQPENPKDSAKQDLDIEDTSTLIVPAGATVEQKQVTKAPGFMPLTNTTVYTVPTNTTVHHSHIERSHSDVGAAQKDTLGETIAKLKSAKIFVVIGIVVCIGGVFLAVYPPAEVFLGGFTPGAILAAVGLVIAVLPYVIIGNEKLLSLLIAGAAAVGLAFWWIHKHGGIQAELLKLKKDLAPDAKPPGQTTSSGLKAPLD